VGLVITTITALGTCESRATAQICGLWMMSTYEHNDSFFAKALIDSFEICTIDPALTAYP
jgi:hypothetical protein